MQIFFSEHNKDYGSYTFDYAVYAIMDEAGELPEIYAKGFLPYSNDLEDKKETFYLARSLRVDLDLFEDSSENRRVNRKMEELDLQLKVFPSGDFDFNDKHFRSLCLNYANERFSGSSMDEDRFDYILNRRILSHIFQYNNKEGKAVAYIFTLLEKDMLHYWYAYFDTSYLGSVPIGKWLMWSSINWAKQNSLNHVYLGTCYGTKALYKARDFKSLSFFDGHLWNKDIKTLKKWCNNDDIDLPCDRYKLKD